MNTFWLGLLAGMVIGSALGFFCAALLACSREKTFQRINNDYDADIVDAGKYKCGDIYGGPDAVA